MNKNENSRRVVVTGLGVVTSIGIGWQDFWKNLLAGKSGISKIESFDTSQYDRHYGGEVKNFDPCQFIDKRKVHQMGRTSQMAIAAAKLAIKDAGFTIKFLPKERTGVCIGTTMGEGQIIEKVVEDAFQKQKTKKGGMPALSYPADAILTNFCKELKLSGQNYLFSTACSAGNYAIGYSFDLIRSGEIDFALAGGADALSNIAFTGFSRLFSMAPEKCQPFDKNRKGMMLGEGAGILILESLESAKKRKADIYAEVLGYGLACDALHMTKPSSRGIEKAVTVALENSFLDNQKVDYICAHGTGTKENDKTECEIFKKIFKKNIEKIPVSSIKSMLGHTMGAAAAIEAVACCLAIKNSKIPPTINFKTKDEECDIDCVPNKFRKHKIKVALNNSLAFGGNDACLVLENI